VSSTVRDDSTLVGLAVAGIIAVVLVAAHLWLPLTGEAAEWGFWGLLGVAVPAAVAWLARARVPAVLACTLAIVGAGAVGWYVFRVGHWIALPLCVAQVLLAAGLRRESVHPLDMLIAAGAWAAVGTLGRTIWDIPAVKLADYLVRTAPGWIAVTALAFAWVTASLALHDRPARSRSHRWWRMVAAVALAAIVIESLHVDYLFDDVSLHHWGVFTGPAEAVRNGGWLLWDTPATYGFLSTLAMVATPTESVWDGFLLLNALACAVSAGILFWLLRDHFDPLLALVLSMAAVLWLPGGRSGFFSGGVLFTPNAGPFRFVWCHALLAVAAFRPQRPLALVLGTLVWLTGVLWSSESAVYCSVTWLPAYALLTWRQPIRARIRWLGVPPLLALAAVAMITGYYWLHLGHGPDWYMFVEASVAVQGGVVALPIGPRGAVAVLVLVGWLVATAAVGTLRSHNLPEIAPLCAAFGLLWATSSYFVGRSHDINVVNLLPGCCLAAAVALRERPGDAPVRVAVGTLFAAVLLLALHEPSGWYPRRPLAQRWALRVDAQRPVLRTDQLELMRRAGIEQGMPVVFYGQNVLEAWPREQGRRVPDVPWLPVMPFTELVPVTESRRALYIARFVDRTREGGWLIEDTSTPYFGGGGPWFFAALARHFVPGPQVEVGHWRATPYFYDARSGGDPPRASAQGVQ
jgi:hypothetical protein